MSYPREDRKFSDPGEALFRLLCAGAVTFLILFALYVWRIAASGYGFMFLPGVSFGLDFLNTFGAAKLVLSGAIEQIYDPDAFASFQASLAGESLKLRLWAYPPHSLIVIWPFALGGYQLMFAGWTAAGLGVLALGARRFGFNWTDTAILTFSPASLQCVLLGQSGNVFCGLLLMAFAGTSMKTPSAAIAAALLTVKPQIGFLIPVFWLLQKRWTLMLATAGLAIALIAASIALFGVAAWTDYVNLTLPALSEIETNGFGGFVYIIPSVFMSLRLLGMEGADARLMHMAFAAIILILLIWRLRKAHSAKQQTALIMVGTCLLTPYLHFYDLSILLAAMLVLFRQQGADRQPVLASSAGALAAWALPIAMAPLGRAGMPLAPLVILALFAVVSLWRPRESQASVERYDDPRHDFATKARPAS